MSEEKVGNEIAAKIVRYMEVEGYKPRAAETIARDLKLDDRSRVGKFWDALRGLMREGKVILGEKGGLRLDRPAAAAKPVKAPRVQLMEEDDEPDTARDPETARPVRGSFRGPTAGLTRGAGTRQEQEEDRADEQRHAQRATAGKHRNDAVVAKKPVHRAVRAQVETPAAQVPAQVPAAKAPAAGATPSRLDRRPRSDSVLGIYRGNKRGFGFVVPLEAELEVEGHTDLFIPPGDQGGAVSGDTVRAIITSRGTKDGKPAANGRVIEVMERGTKRFVGTLAKRGTKWVVLPDGNVLLEAIETPDAAGRHVPVGAKVVVELTTYPELDTPGVGVITEVLGKEGEKDVDLKSIIVQHNLPGAFPEAVTAEARQALDSFDAEKERSKRLDMTGDIICTIDPDDAKDYDDAISLRMTEDGLVELGVHIADVSHFVKTGGALDEEAKVRGNSIYFPGHVIPMLPEVLSNGVCSLQEGVARLCKSAFITYDEDAEPVRARFANTVIKSAKRLRYREAQALIDAAEKQNYKAAIPHPDGDKRLGDYEPEVVELLLAMNSLSRRLQVRRLKQGQLVLHLPQVELVLDENGRVKGTAQEDDSFTHTLIEMFMVEANEAVARLLKSAGAAFLRRAHPTPDMEDNDKLRTFVGATGHKLEGEITRHHLQKLLMSVKGRPESYAVNLAVLRSLTRAEYSPEDEGHFALASECYAHFTSPIRRYADLTVHRLLDAYFEIAGAKGQADSRKKLRLDTSNLPSFNDLAKLGKQISFTERRAEDAERELRKVKILMLLEGRVGEEFAATVTGVANFGVFVQLNEYLVDGVIRFQDLANDFWQVDERSGQVVGKRTGTRIGIGDAIIVRIAKVNTARRELDLALIKVTARIARTAAAIPARGPTKKQYRPEKSAGKPKDERSFNKHRSGTQARAARSKQRDRKKSRR
jgi:ribonuclease R